MKTSRSKGSHSDGTQIGSQRVFGRICEGKTYVGRPIYVIEWFVGLLWNLYMLINMNVACGLPIQFEC